ncbi:hypothetical protein BV898_06795 [Hypsibius exemplaris]|uniref:Uncharacterized protein n=1 Tax=Hypsibius exemplaris TaxID=2072580 RepID=A0A1W0WVD2_HYPEX|nr:hypothetical protein BV898_06795 [Hypsibius exemplaris]
MDNLEKAMSSVAGIGKTLKKGIPKIGKRKASMSYSSAGKAVTSGATNEEETNAVIAKIPHSPSMPGESSTLNIRKISELSDTAASPSFSHLTNYSSDPFKLLAVHVFRSMQHHAGNGPQQATHVEGCSLATLTKVIQITENTIEKDEPWKWQELIAELSTANTGKPSAQEADETVEQLPISSLNNATSNSPVKSVFTFPKRVANGHARKL